MNINKNSWHYKYSKMWPGDNQPWDLCAYVRRLIWTIALGIVLIPACLVGLGVVPFGMFMGLDPVFNFVQAGGGVWLTVYTIWALLAGFVLYTIAAIGLTVFCIATLVEEVIKPWKLRRAREWRPKKPNMFTEWYQAVKGKYCPHVNYHWEDK